MVPKEWEEFVHNLPNVSRETIDLLDQFLYLLMKWNDKINLISKGESSKTIWQRHIIDSLQLWPLINEYCNGNDNTVLTDFGSGGGFPGLILGLVMKQELHLIESDRRKVVFLKEASRTMKLDHITIHNERIEVLKPWKSTIVTSRALAPLKKLFSLIHGYTTSETVGFLLKGKEAAHEWQLASKEWDADIKFLSSVTDLEGNIICFKHLMKKEYAND